MKGWVLLHMMILGMGIFGQIGCREDERTVSFGIAYGKITPENVGDYRVVILEPDHYNKSEIDAFKARGSKLIAYISVGEVNPNRWYYPHLEARGFLGVNEIWGSYYFKLDDEETRKVLLDRALPNIMIKGFDGIFLDTVDNVAPYTDRAYLQDDMASLIGEMRTRYPEALIVQNAGLFLLDRTASFIDAVLIEDVASDYDFDNAAYRLKPEADYLEKIALIQDHADRFGKPFWIVDFAATPSLKQQIAQRLDAHPFAYFVSTIDFEDLPPVN